MSLISSICLFLFGMFLATLEPLTAKYRKLEVWQQSAVWIVVGFILMVTILYGPWY